MRTIWKYKLDVLMNEESVVLNLPVGFIIRHVDYQREALYIWVELDTDNVVDTKPVRFAVVGTGHTFRKIWGKYVGSVQFAEDGVNYVWHIYMEG